jgi:murein DD-endopeptidase MepM/ murein hydrolase activator NlpD
MHAAQRSGFHLIFSDVSTSLLRRLQSYAARHYTMLTCCFLSGFFVAGFLYPQAIAARKGWSIKQLSLEIAKQTSLLEGADSLPEKDSAANPLVAASANEVSDSSSGPDEVREKIKFLANEYVRLKKYEEQLKRRADSLDALLHEVDRLSLSPTDIADDNIHVERPRRRSYAHWGLGGGDVPKSPIIHAEGKKPAAAKSNTSETLGTTEGKTSLLTNELDTQVSRLASVPLGRPINVPITSGFGVRLSPFSGRAQRHQGVDFSVERLSPVVATAEGLVINAGPKSGYGNCVLIQHANGIETLYGHLDKVSVREGEHVCRGERVGFAGSTGHSTGPHVHYEVRLHGTPVNPVPFIDIASFARLFRQPIPDIGTL